MLNKQHRDKGDAGHDNNEEEEEKVLPMFKEGDRYGFFFSGLKKVTCRVDDLFLVPDSFTS